MARTEDALQREQYVRGVKTEVAIARTRAEVASLSAELVQGGFAGWGGGDVSSRVAGADLFVIKPPAGEHDDLAPENAIVCDHEGCRSRAPPAASAFPHSMSPCMRGSTATSPRSAGSSAASLRTPSPRGDG